MNNLTTVSYNLQLIYNNLNGLTNKVNQLESQFFQLKDEVKEMTKDNELAKEATPIIQQTPGVTPEELKAVTDDYNNRVNTMENTFLMKLDALNTSIQDIQKVIGSLDSLPILSSPIDTPCATPPPVETSPVVPADDDLLISMTPAVAPKAKGGRKKK